MNGVFSELELKRIREEQDKILSFMSFDSEEYKRIIRESFMEEIKAFYDVLSGNAIFLADSKWKHQTDQNKPQ